MNWGELKEQIRDLGFEDDSIASEYKDVIINSSNRAINIINKTVVARAEQFFKNEYKNKHENDNDYVEWEIPTIKKITVDTPDDFELNLPDKVTDLISLLASHYVWLDDDISKATYYWNEYDDFKEQLLTDCLRSRTATIRGGLSWGR